jgi:hypothetical protein
MSRTIQLWFGEHLQWQLTWDDALAVELARAGEVSEISRREAGQLMRAAYRIEQPDAYFRERPP